MQTYVLRVWVPRSFSDEQGRLCGIAEHISSGRTMVFRNDAEILGFLREHANVVNPSER